jgi:hypothetical protein
VAFQQNAGTLGLIANTIQLEQYDANKHLIVNAEVDGLTLATNTFNAVGYENGAIQGTFKQMGGYIVGSAGFFGEINLSGTLLAGYEEERTYDPRLQTNPPPYFPTTGNKYSILSWSEDASPFS